MGSVKIRPMEEGDLEVVAQMEERLQPRPWSLGVLRDELAAENRMYLVAGDPAVAYGGVMVVGDEGHVTNLLVATAHRRKGIARRILFELIEGSQAMGAKHLTLEVRSRNSAARSLYASVGLVPVGVRPGYYGDDDALIMWSHDVDTWSRLESVR